MAALETKLASSEKEVQQLKKALENSDLYIEELEKQLEMRGHDVMTGNNSEIAKKNAKLVSEGSLSEILNNSEQSVNLSTTSSSDIPMEMVNIGTDEMPSFLLEVPSTDTTLSEQSILEINDGNRDVDQIKECHKPERSMSSAAVSSFTLKLPSPSISGATSSRSRCRTDKESIGESALASRSSACRDEPQAISSSEQTADSYTKRLRFADPDDHFAKTVRKSLFGEQTPTASPNERIGNTTNVDLASTSQFYGSRTTDSSGQYGQRLDNQNSSVTSEVEDCLRLMDAIERKVKERTSESSGLNHNITVFTSNGSCTQSASTSQSLPVSYAGASLGETNGGASHDLNPVRHFLFPDSSKH